MSHLLLVILTAPGSLPPSTTCISNAIHSSRIRYLTWALLFENTSHRTGPRPFPFRWVFTLGSQSADRAFAAFRKALAMR